MSVFDQQAQPLDFNQQKEFGQQTQFKELYAGAGSNIFKVNAEGLFMGATNYTNAPFKVSWAGAVTMTSATITGYIATGGAAADVNAGATTINGGKITAASITTTQIAASTITGSNIAAGTITATNITAGTITATEIANSTITGGKIANATITATNIVGGTITAAEIANSTITGSKIAASTITASNLSVTTLSSITANLGTITAGSITGVTITGGTVQTATSGQRVVMSSNTLTSYDSAGTKRFDIVGGDITWYLNASSAAAAINGYAAGVIEVIAGTSFYYISQGAIDMVTNQLANCGDIFPYSAGNYNLGTATLYWNDVSYKTLTDRGCLSSCDDGVELQDGRIVSDTEAIKAIKKRDDGKKTVYGMPMLDYKTFPKISYKPAQKEGETEGVEMTSMFSVMLGAIKELTLRIEKLETKLT